MSIQSVSNTRLVRFREDYSAVEEIVVSLTYTNMGMKEALDEALTQWPRLLAVAYGFRRKSLTMQESLYSAFKQVRVEAIDEEILLNRD